MANVSNSAADHITPTYAAGTLSIISGTLTGDLLNDSVSSSGANGYTNNFDGYSVGISRVGGYNSAWTNGCLSKSITPTYTSSLIQFGTTGRQS